MIGFNLGQPPGDLVDRSRAAAARVSGAYGIVHRCVTLDAPITHGLTVVAAAGPYRMPGWKFFVQPEGTGVARDEESARLAAVAETVERYASIAPAAEEMLVRAACAELDGAAVPVSSFALLSPSQYRRFRRLHPVSDTHPIDWVWSASLTRNRPALVPASLVFLGRERHPPNDFVAEVTSTGAACHVSLPHAVLAGLCEVLERDALTIWWQNRLPPTELDPTGTPVAELLPGLDRAGYRLKLYTLPTASPFPVVLAQATSEGAQPCAAVGVACRPSPEAAALRAAFEAVQVLVRLCARGPHRPDRVRTLDDHADFYATPAGARLLHRAVAPATTQRLDEVSNPAARWPDVLSQIDGAVSALEKGGLEVLVSELSTVDVALAGYSVVRVLIPGALDIAVDARCPRLGGRRLYDVPVELGLRATPLAESDINRLPVPLA